MSYKIATVKGIPIYLHVTFLLVFLLFAFIFSITDWPLGFRQIEPAWTKYLLAGLTAAFFFVTILIHELAHSILARSYGVKIQSITLFFFGGISAMENPENEKNMDPSKELNISLAGPLSNMIIGLLLLAFNYLIYGSVFGIPDSTHWIVEGLAVFTYNIPTVIFLVGILNLLLGLFNILPIYPMDGGRVLRAWLAKRQSYEEATKTTVSIGKGFSIILAVIGILTNWWLAILALFLYISVAEEGKMFKTTTLLEGVFVGEIMTTEVLTVPESMTLHEFVDFVLQKKHPGYPVTGMGGTLVGMVTVDDARFVNEAERYAFTVKDVMKEAVSIAPEATALEAFNEMGTHGIGRLVVLDNEKNIVGIVSRTDLMTAIYIKDSFKEKAEETESF